MKNPINQLLRTPIAELSSAERKLCFQQIGLQTQSSGGTINACVFNGMWLPKALNMTIVLNFKTKKHTLKINDLIRPLNEDCTMEQLVRMIKEY